MRMSGPACIQSKTRSFHWLQFRGETDILVSNLDSSMGTLVTAECYIEHPVTVSGGNWHSCIKLGHIDGNTCDSRMLHRTSCLRQSLTSSLLCCIHLLRESFLTCAAGLRSDRKGKSPWILESPMLPGTKCLRRGSPNAFGLSCTKS